jgi:hypothetical protein
MASTDQSVLWLYHQRENLRIRWVELSDKVGPRFLLEWFLDAVSEMEMSADTSPKYVLAPREVVTSIVEELDVPFKEWLASMSMTLLVDASLELTSEVFRMVILDEEVDRGSQITWVKKVVPVEDLAPSAFDLISSGASEALVGGVG